MTAIKLYWPGKGFGNVLITAHLTKILCDNGIEAYFQDHRKTYGLLDVNTYQNQTECIKFRCIAPSTYKHKYVDEPVLRTLMRAVGKLVNKQIQFKREIHNFIPVKFTPLSDIPSFDVAMNTVTGSFGPYREWPYFENLMNLFERNGITYIDLNKAQIYSNTCLNYVKNAKVYLGLDTGMSHYVSKFANNKALIIQGGFNTFYYWAWPYEYEPIFNIVKCDLRPCFINSKDIYRKKRECPYNQICMRSITAEQVFYRVCEMLNTL